MYALLLTMLLGIAPWGAGILCPSVEWVKIASDQTQTALMVDGKQLGNFRSDINEFHVYDQKTDSFTLGEVPSPYSIPESLRIKPGVNYGVDKTQFHNKERYVFNGQDVSSDEAFKVLTDKKVPDDKNLIRLTVIGLQEDVQKVKKDIENNPTLERVKEKYLVQYYDPNNWAVKDVFYTQGSPTIYVQSPNGKVLHRQDDYEDGAVGLVTALRKVDPSYNAKEDIDFRKASKTPKGSTYLPLGILIFLICVVVMVPKKKK